MLRYSERGVEWLEFELLADCPGIDHRVFLRHGGFSEGLYGSLNLGAKSDRPQNLQANLAKIRDILNCSAIVQADQKHGAEIEAVDSTNRLENFVCDGLSTNTKHIPLLIKHADCQAACFYDPIKKAVTMIHCGWRGNVQNIYARAVEKMQGQYGSQPADILVCISPSLGPERSEFINYRTELPEHFWDFQYKENYFDLWAISERQLLKAGLLPHHVQIARISTWLNEDDYFSYRRSKVTGIHGSVAILKGKDHEN